MVLCPRHLAVESTFRGSLRLVHPGRKLEDLDYTCMWDWIDAHRDGATLSDVGRELSINRPRAHQVWKAIQDKLVKQMGPDWADKLSASKGGGMADEEKLEESRARYPIHPAAGIMPLLEGAAFDALVEDIRIHGQRERIVLFEDQIIDGRNRYLACKKLGIEPKFTTWDGRGSDPVEYVLSLNLKRRHLNESQRAIVAANLSKFFEEEARQRRLAALKHGDAAPVTADPQERGESAAKAAVLLSVSTRVVYCGRKVKSEGVPELPGAVMRREVAVTAAAEIATLPPEQQRQALAGVRGPSEPTGARMRRADARMVRGHLIRARAALSDLFRAVCHREVDDAMGSASAVAAIMQATLRKLRRIQRESAVRGEVSA
jgi:hypothetical protein